MPLSGKIAEFFIFGLAPFVLGMLAVPFSSLATERTVSGEVLYRERIALPPNAVLTIELVDVSLADAAAAIIGKQVIAPAGQVPIKFAIVFDSARIRPGMPYALHASIGVEGTVWFINDERHQIDPLAEATQSMVLKMVRRSETPADPSIFDLTWVVEAIEGTAVGGNARPTFAVSAGGMVSGSGPCNRYFGTAEVHDGTIEIAEIGTTFMACATDLMEKEKTFLDALRRAAAFRIRDGILVLADDAGKDILRLSASTTTE